MNERWSFLPIFSQKNRLSGAKAQKRTQKAVFYSLRDVEKRYGWRFFEYSHHSQKLVLIDGGKVNQYPQYHNAGQSKRAQILWIMLAAASAYLLLVQIIVPKILRATAGEASQSPAQLTAAQATVQGQQFTPEKTDFQLTQQHFSTATKAIFSAGEVAHIKIFKKGYLVPAANAPQGLDIAKPLTVTNVEVIGPYNEQIEIGKDLFSDDFQQEGKNLEVLSIVPGNGFHAGRYTVRATVSDGAKTATEESTFVWGVLVVNPEKSIYRPGETAKFGMAVLDYTGKTLCQADLRLTITSPAGKKTVLDTADGSIARNYDCDVHSVSNIPDYSAEYVPEEVGAYQLSLSSVIKKGQERTGYDQSYAIEDSFEVRASVPFDISRSDTPTRLYPVVDYTANITVTANEPWLGPVIETVPASFEIYAISDGGALSAPAPNGTRTITWPVDWQMGETHSLSYRFNPPNPSPRIYPIGPLQIDTFHENRAWQMAADATRVWDGGAAGANWSNATNWDGNIALAAGDTVVFDGSAGGTPTDASDWNAVSAVSSIASLSVSASPPSTLTFTKTPAAITGNFSYTSTGAVTFGNTLALTVGGDYTNTTSGTFTPGTATLILSGTSNTINTTKTHSNLTIDGAGAVITVNTNDLTVSSLLTIGGAADSNNDKLVIGSGRTVTLSGASGTTLTINNSGTDEIDGPGRLIYQNSATNFPTVGTLAAALITRFDTLNGNMTIPARTDYGAIEAYGGSANARTVTLGTAGSQTITASGYFYVMADAAATNNVTIQGATYDPTLNVGGTFDFTGTGAATEIVTAPDAAATWTVTGDVNLTDGTWTASAETLKMNGTANAITGGGATLANLNIDPASAGTITLQTSDLSVSTLLTVASADTLSLTASRTLTLTATSGTSLTLTGTISGDGRLTYTSSTTFPSTGIISSTLRIVLAGNITLPDRLSEPAVDYGGDLELYETVAGTYQIYTVAGTYRIGGDLLLSADGAGYFAINGDYLGANPAVFVAGNIDYLGVGAGLESITTGSGTWTISGSVDLTDGSFSASAGNTINMNGTGGQTLTAPSVSFYNLTIDPASAAAITIPSGSITATGALTVASDDTLTITDSASTLTLSGQSGTTLVPNGTINGSGRLSYSSSDTFPATGTLNCIVRIVARYATSLSPRTFGSDLEIYHAGTIAATSTVDVSASGTLAVTGQLLISANGNGSVTLDAATVPDPDANLTVGSNLDFSGAGGGTEYITAGSGTWTVGGDVTFTDGQYNIAAGNTLVMNGSGKTLTSAGQTLGNVMLSGSITLANAAHTVSGNLSMAGGTITPGTSTVSMTGTSNTIVGGGNTLANLTINPASAGTITVQTSDLTVSATLEIAAGDTLSIAASRTLTHTGATLTWGDGTSTISGSGTLRFTDASGGPGTGGVLSAVTRFDASSDNIASTTFDARTYSGEVDLYANSGTAKTVSCADAATYTLSGATSHLYLFAEGDGGLSLLCDTATDPTVTVGGSLDYQGAGGGSESITTGAGTWTVSGDVDFTDGTLTATTGNTFRMNGASTVLTSAGQSFKNFAVTGGAISNVDAMDVNGTFDVTSGEFTAAAAVNMNISGNFTLANGTTFTGPTGAGKMIFDGDLTLTDSNDTKQNLGNVQIGTSPDTTNLASDTKFLTLTVASGDVLYTNGYDLDVNGTITINGTFDATDDVETDETTV
ncbi:MAG: hypothetical protein V1778_02305, partial [bacterium]